MADVVVPAQGAWEVDQYGVLPAGNPGPAGALPAGFLRRGDRRLWA